MDVRDRFKCYWHAVHPMVFNPNDLYRLAFSSEEWSAIMLLRQCFPGMLKRGYSWTYVTNKTEGTTEIVMHFNTDDGMPQIALNECDLPDRLAARLRDWALEAQRYDEMDSLLFDKLNTLVRMEYHYDDYNRRSGGQAQVNTPGTMYRVWPEILPFLNDQSRTAVKNMRVKPSLPRNWDDAEYRAFHEGDAMEELTIALATMALMADGEDRNYPKLSY